MATNGDKATEFYNIGNWLSTKLKYHKISEYKHIKSKQINIGEVWQCDLGYNIGEEKNKMRPVLVVSNNRINRSGKIIVICITDAKDKLNKQDLPSQDSWCLLYSDTKDDTKMFRAGRIIPKNQNTYSFLSKDSVVQCEEIRSISKARIDNNKGLLGTIHADDFKFIQQKLKRTFDIL